MLKNVEQKDVIVQNKTNKEKIQYLARVQLISYSTVVFQIRDIFKRIRILGSVLWITDPSPALFVSGLQKTNKK